ncbi:MAG: hypothetical protein WKG07_33510 [Hymenobacter sp.]
MPGYRRPPRRRYQNSPRRAAAEAYAAGARIFGETGRRKWPTSSLSYPPTWRAAQIGQFPQTNKVKLLAPFVHTVRERGQPCRLLLELDKQAARHDRVIRGLFQFHIAQEATKTGLSLPEAEEILQSTEYQAPAMCA